MSEAECGLARAAAAGMVTCVMSAAEIIEMIKKLPPEEKAEVIAFAQNAEPSATEVPKIRYMSKEKFEEIAPKIFDKHHELFRRLAQ